jgi:putative transposase
MCADCAVSIRRGRYGCAIGSSDPDDGPLRFDCSSYHDQSRRTDPAALKARIKEICETRVRYVCRRVHVVLDREGWRHSIKKTYSVYRGMQSRNKTRKRRVKAKLREDRAEAVGPTDVRAME